MINIKINNKNIRVAKGISVLEAAESFGINVPSMCYLKGHSNHPSCMVCMVKNAKTGQLFPSCGMPVSEGMEIITDDEEVKESRKEALELLLSDHVGDCEAPCRVTCPAFMDIPKMNRLIAEGKHIEALKVVKQEIALPLILGYICPAPCEKACRRTQVDSAVAICQLKKFTAQADIKNNNTYFPEKNKESGKKAAIIGTGPAGLSCAFYLLKFGHKVVLYDKNSEPGGTLRYDIPDDILPKDALDTEIEIIKNYGAEFKLNTLVTQDFFKSELSKKFDAIIFATGDFNKTNLKEFGFESNSKGLSINKDTFEIDNIGIFACGNVIRSRKMAVTSVAQGKATSISVDAFLKGEKPEKKHRMFNSRFGKLFGEEIEEYKKETTPDKRIELKNKRLDTFDESQAIAEAKRCMHCDCRKPETCKLRIYSEEYKAERTRFLFGERKKVTKHFNHDFIIYEPQKCIRCNLCVDITKNEKIGFTAIRRGFDVEINMPFNKSLKELIAKAAELCAKHCPTGAISMKNNEEM